MSKMTFLPQNLSVPINEAESVLEVALKNKIDLDHSCEGMGSCTTCRVFVREGLEKLGERNEVESDRAEERDFSDEERLACQITPHAGLVVEIPE